MGEANARIDRLVTQFFYVLAGNTKGGSTIILLTSYLTRFGISCMTTDDFLQTSQTGGQWYNDTSPFSIPWFFIKLHTDAVNSHPLSPGDIFVSGYPVS
jgi:hypothetical protein